MHDLARVKRYNSSIVTVPVKKVVKKQKNTLISLVNMVDSYFFGDSEEEKELKPYFYGSMSFGIIMTILVIIM